MIEADGNATERAIANISLFAAFSFLITWGTGMLVVLSTQASLVNGAHQVRNPIALPKAMAIVLVIIGSFGPFLAPRL